MQDQPRLLDLDTLSTDSGDQHLLGSLASSDLNVNMMAFSGDEGIAEHINTEVDVLIAAMEGAGILTIDERRLRLTAGQATIVPKGAVRAIQSAGDRFAYLTCHGRRMGLMPKHRSVTL